MNLVFLRSVRQLLITATVFSSPVTLMEALSSSETSLLTRTTRRNIPEEGILPTLLDVVQTSNGIRGNLLTVDSNHGNVTAGTRRNTITTC
jgi:hypothetical protein